MTNGWKTLRCICLLFGAVIFTGCADKEDGNEQAAQEVEQLKLQVAQTTVLLQKARAESDELTTALSEQTEKLAKLQTEYNAVVKERDTLQMKLGQISQTHEGALLRAQEAQRANENLQKQLQEKSDEAQELQNYNRELNISIERMQNQPQPEPQPQPEENQQPQEQSGEVVE